MTDSSKKSATQVKRKHDWYDPNRGDVVNTYYKCRNCPAVLYEQALRPTDVEDCDVNRRRHKIMAIRDKFKSEREALDIALEALEQLLEECK
jgi:hypothetical protein